MDEFIHSLSTAYLWKLTGQGANKQTMKCPQMDHMSVSADIILTQLFPSCYNQQGERGQAFHELCLTACACIVTFLQAGGQAVPNSTPRLGEKHSLPACWPLLWKRTNQSGLHLPQGLARRRRRSTQIYKPQELIKDVNTVRLLLLGRKLSHPYSIIIIYWILWPDLNLSMMP